ncbi:lysis protein, partial [Pseudomonas aeruginosa]|nr:lysis protein [Pseudomonas aeruginosa]
VIHGSASYDRGYATGRAEGDAALLNLQLQHTNERAQALQDALVQYKQQVARANQAEEQLLQVQQQLTDTRHQLQERIAHVSTAYRAAPGAAPTAIPRCVFTRGWVRDFNTALGAGLPAAGARADSAGAQTATWPAAGSDAELLESGVTPADILAFAQDYGAWSLRNLAQLNALLEQGE